MLVGRDAERARVGALLEAAQASRSGAIVLRGEAGMGKTAMLDDAREQAGGMHVLTARGVESESDLPFAGLHQLLRPALHLVERLPGPQAEGLRGALGLAERAGDDRFLISVACLTLLSELAEDAPVLCLVDDAHWLDAPSADALLFVARRLGAEGIVMLFTARETTDLDFAAGDLPSLEIGALDAESASALLTVHARVELAPGVRSVLLEESGGNALALVELPAALSHAQLVGEEPLPDALPLTRGVERIFLERVAGLPEDTRRLLVVIAADDTGRLATVMSAAGQLGIAAEALAPAEEAGVVAVRSATLELRHPLVRSAVYRRAPSAERRAVHSALADALAAEQEPDQRAWHLAAAASGPDAAVAAELELMAERARVRSGHAAAATALERAARLSVDDESRGRRLVGAGTEAWDAGQPDRALALLEDADAIVSEPALRAQLEHVRGEIQLRCGSVLEAYDTLVSGSAIAAELNVRKSLDMLLDAAYAAATAGDYRRYAEAGRLAGSLPLSETGVDRLMAELLVGVGSLQRGESAEDMSRILGLIEHGDELDEPRWLTWACGGAQLVGEKALAKEFLRRAIALSRSSAKREQLAPALSIFVLDGLIQGRHSVLAEAEEGLALSREAGLTNVATTFLASSAWLAAVRDDSAACRTYAAEAIERARVAGAGVASSVAEWALAILDLTGGQPARAAERLEAVRTAPPGVGSAYVALLCTADLVEAHVRTGRTEQAATAETSLAAFAEPQGPAWARGLAARCRALLAHGEDAASEFEHALELHEEDERGFDRARTALLYGEALRRERRRVDARSQLSAALDGFERLGAEAWARRARAELRASGATARTRDPSTVNQLTPQELQIARFVAEGLSNKEVAAQLFLSPRTIDYHLRNVFAKLGITSRTQLAGIAREHESLAGIPAGVAAS